jgi:AcrR family transcriptional regulator
MSGPVKRSYRSPLREDAVRRTRALLREAGHRLFTAQGFAATTMRQIAAEAGVAERTLYATFPSKIALFSEVLDVAIVGDDRPVPVAERPAWQQALAQQSAAQLLELYVDYGTELLERAGDLMMVMVESSGADPDMRELYDGGVAANRSDHRTVARALADTGGLRDGTDVDQAADILFTLGSPHTHQLLRQHCGWTRDQHRAWLLATLINTLL